MSFTPPPLLPPPLPAFAPSAEATAYAAQQHQRFLPDGARRGFLIGDGAGVGKGREISCIIVDHLRRVVQEEAAPAQAAAKAGGRASASSSSSSSSSPAPKSGPKSRVAVWFSINSDLAVDAARDLRDIGAGALPVVKMGAGLPYKAVELLSAAELDKFRAMPPRDNNAGTSFNWLGDPTYDPADDSEASDYYDSDSEAVAVRRAARAVAKARASGRGGGQAAGAGAAGDSEMIDLLDDDSESKASSDTNGGGAALTAGRPPRRGAAAATRARGTGKRGRGGAAGRRKDSDTEDEEDEADSDVTSDDDSDSDEGSGDSTESEGTGLTAAGHKAGYRVLGRAKLAAAQKAKSAPHVAAAALGGNKAGAKSANLLNFFKRAPEVAAAEAERARRLYGEDPVDPSDAGLFKEAAPAPSSALALPSSLASRGARNPFSPLGALGRGGGSTSLTKGSVLFFTYASIVREGKRQGAAPPGGRGRGGTGSSEKMSRLDQLVEYLGPDWDGVLVSATELQLRGNACQASHCVYARSVTGISNVWPPRVCRPDAFATYPFLSLAGV